MKSTEQVCTFHLLFNLDFSSRFLQVHAQGGNRSEAQHSSASTLHPGPQREDLPVLGDERRLPYRVAARGEGPAATASPQPLSGEEEGDHQEASLLHRWGYESATVLRGTQSKQEAVASHRRRHVLLSSYHCCSQEVVACRPLLSVFALLHSLKTHNCNLLSSAISSPVSPLRFASTQMFARSPIYALIALFKTQIWTGNFRAPASPLPSIWDGLY